MKVFARFLPRAARVESVKFHLKPRRCRCASCASTSQRCCISWVRFLRPLDSLDIWQGRIIGTMINVAGGVRRRLTPCLQCVRICQWSSCSSQARSCQINRSYYVILYPLYAHMDTARIDFFVSSCKNTHTHKLTQTRAFFFARSKESKVLGVLDLLCLLADVQLLLFPAMLQLFVTCIHLRARFCFQQDPTASAELCFPYPKFIWMAAIIMNHWIIVK